MQLKRIQESACWQTGEQSLKLMFGVAAVITLILINSNVHDLVTCLSSQTSTQSLLATSTQHLLARSSEKLPASDSNPPLYWTDCTVERVNESLPVTLTFCDSAAGPGIRVQFDGDEIAHYVHPRSTALAVWMRKCGTQLTEACPHVPYPPASGCSAVSFHDADFICYDSASRLRYLLMGHVRFPKPDAQRIMAEILYHMK